MPAGAFGNDLGGGPAPETLGVGRLLALILGALQGYGTTAVGGGSGATRVRHEFHCAPSESVVIPVTALSYLFFITGSGNDTTVGSNTAHAAGTAESIDYGLSAPLTLTAGAAAYIDGVYLTAP